MIRRPPRSTLFPLHDALPISRHARASVRAADLGRHAPRRAGVRAHLQAWPADPHHLERGDLAAGKPAVRQDRKSTRLNSSHANISYAVFCLKKKKMKIKHNIR